MEYCFIIGSGRSGTTFLSHLFQGLDGVFADHEYIGNREYWLLSWYIGEAYSVPFLERAKKKIESTHKVNKFIDINGYLQNSAPYLQKVFKDAVILHLVRDPRLVVRSLYMRRSENNIHLIPKTAPEIEKWLDEDKFYQVCWNWANSTRILLNQGIPLINFEKLVSNYNYCNDHLFTPFHISISEVTWRQKVNTKVKQTKPRIYRYLYSKLRGKPFIEEKIPAFEEWNSVQKEIFKELCGDLMLQCGYQW